MITQMCNVLWINWSNKSIDYLIIFGLIVWCDTDTLTAIYEWITQRFSSIYKNPQFIRKFNWIHHHHTDKSLVNFVFLDLWFGMCAFQMIKFSNFSCLLSPLPLMLLLLCIVFFFTKNSLQKHHLCHWTPSSKQMT